MKMILLLSFSLFSFALWSQAPGYVVEQKDCTPTDIRDTNPRIKNNPEMRNHFSSPRDQDSIGWCYAFAAADLMTAEMGTPVSALHSSIIFNHETFKNDSRRKWGEEFRAKEGRFSEVYEGGWSNKAIEDARRNRWICSEKSLPFDMDRPEQIKTMIDELENLKRMKEMLKVTGSYTANEHVKTCEMIQDIARPFKISEEAVSSIANSLINQNMNQTLHAFANSVCTEKIHPIPKIRLKDVFKQDNSDKNRRNYMRDLNRALAQGKPIQLSYKPKYISTSPDGSHASIIIGRRWNKGRCEYNIRNSWGKSCGLYLPEIECNREEGSFWMSDAQLFEASNSFRFVK